MSQNLIVALQTLLIFLQIINGQIAVVTHNPVITLVIGAVVGAVQYYVQHIGNASLSPENALAMQQAGVVPTPPQSGDVAAPAPPVPPTATTGFGSTTMASGAMLGHGVIPPAPASATVTTNKKW